MPEQTPTIGRVVHYTLAEHEASALAELHADEIGRTLNRPRAGQAYPAVIVAVWGDQPGSAVNLRVQLDGLAEHWATSRCIADEHQTEGRWAWPARA